MKMKSVFVLIMVFCLTIGLCACGSDSKDDAKDTKKDPTISTTDKVTTPTLNTPTETSSVKTAASTTAATNNETHTTASEPSEDPSAPASTTNTTATQPVDGKANYTVIVTDEAGNPMPGVFVQLCLEACVPCMTNAQGVASYPNMAVEDYKVSIISFPDGYTVENNEFHFDENSYEMTIVLKAAN